MPFDCAPDVDVIAARRLRFAVLLMTVPEREFSLAQWCGSAACALGQLAKHQIDGWYYKRGAPTWDGLNDYTAAAIYFGIPFDKSIGIFGTHTRKFYGCYNPREVRPYQVAAALLAL